MNNIINTDILDNNYFNLKYNNILNNTNRYHDKIITLPLFKISKNLYHFIINIYKNISNHNLYLQILYVNDRIFYFGLLIIFIALFIQILIDFFNYL